MGIGDYSDSAQSSRDSIQVIKNTPTMGRAVTLDDQEIRRMLKESTGRTKLSICLILNCGMTQKDVADIRKSEVDFDAGRIIRKRSKTEKFKSVPTVNYLLWPETLRLMKQFADRGDGDLVLLN